MNVEHPRWRLLLLGAALTAGLSACAGHGAQRAAEAGGVEGMDHGGSTEETGHAHDEAAPAAVDGARELAISARSFAFEPAGLRAAVGEPVNVVLASDDILHDFVVEGGDFHLAAEGGETATGALTMDEPGTYTVYCSVAGHREAGMETTLVVE